MWPLTLKDARTVPTQKREEPYVVQKRAESPQIAYLEPMFGVFASWRRGAISAELVPDEILFRSIDVEYHGINGV